MTGLLVSVRSAIEARLAYQGGADIIDVKEPHLGSLGAATPSVWHEVYETVNQRVPVSIALGELCDDHAAPPTHRFAFAKMGLADCQHRMGWQPSYGPGRGRLRRLAGGRFAASRRRLGIWRGIRLCCITGGHVSEKFR